MEKLRGAAFIFLCSRATPWRTTGARLTNARNDNHNSSTKSMAGNETRENTNTALFYAVLYSQSQEAVHVEPLPEYIQKERQEVLLDETTGGYRLVGITGSPEAARELASLWQAWRNERQEGRSGRAAQEAIERFERQESSFA